METKTAQQLLQMKQAEFIENRTKTQTEVDKFYESLEALDPDIQEKLSVTPGTRAKDVFPSLWEETFDEEKYTNEYNAFIKYLSDVIHFCDIINQQAITWLQSA